MVVEWVPDISFFSPPLFSLSFSFFSFSVFPDGRENGCYRVCVWCRSGIIQ